MSACIKNTRSRVIGGTQWEITRYETIARRNYRARAVVTITDMQRLLRPAAAAKSIREARLYVVGQMHMLSAVHGESRRAA